MQSGNQFYDQLGYGFFLPTKEIILVTYTPRLKTDEYEIWMQFNTHFLINLCKNLSEIFIACFQRHVVADGLLRLLKINLQNRT